MTPAPRYAIYFAPEPQHALWRAGCDWLQRDPATDDARAPTRPHIGEPWRYGFHATLKAPMRLAEGRDEAGLVAAVARLAQRFTRFAMPALSVQPLSGFLALQPVQPLPRAHALHRLADACVVELDDWRAPASAHELARRLAEPLDDTEREGLMRHGYPHVLDRWRFHMTLTDPLPDAALRARIAAEAAAHFDSALAAPLACTALCVFVEPAPGQPFRLQHRCPLT
jgi:hypothetical protein